MLLYNMKQITAYANANLASAGKAYEKKIQYSIHSLRLLYFQYEENRAPCLTHIYVW